MNILLTSVGRRGYIVDYFKQVSKDAKIHVCNSVFTIAFRKADFSFIAPNIYDNDYIDSLVEYCKKNKIDAIMSLFDIDLVVLGSSEKRFEEIGVTLVHAPLKTLKICNDKWLTFKFAQEINIATPKTYLSIEDALKEIESKRVYYPLIIKPRFGMGSIGLYVVDNREELQVLYNKCKNEVFNSYLKYESADFKEESVLIQEFKKSKEYGLDIINDLDGNFVTVIPKEKVEMRSGETDLGLTVDNARFIELAKKLSQATKHKGILSVDILADEADTLNLLEMNCRISGHYPVAHCAGVNYPKQLIEWLNKKETNLENFEYKRGVYVTKELLPVVWQ